MWNTRIGDVDYPFTEWNGEKLTGNTVSVDTETCVREFPEIPQVVLMVVSDGTHHYIMLPDKIIPFFQINHEQHFIFQNITFDFWVLDKHYASHNVKNPLYAIIEDNRLHDTMILDMLYRLAVNDDYPDPRDLGYLASTYAGMYIDKDDPYRMRYEEILGKPLDSVDVNFLTYAIKDAIVTYFVFVNLYRKAKELVRKAGILPVVVKEYGLLTENIQIKGAIALNDVSRRGMSIDLPYSTTLYKKLKDEANLLVNELLADDKTKSLFKKDKHGELMVTENNAPRKSIKIFRSMLVAEAARIEKDCKIRVNIPKTEKGAIGTSMKEWAEYKGYSVFIDKMVRVDELLKLCQFFTRLQTALVHPRYTIMVRTGRVSCYAPNCFDANTEVLTEEGWIKFKNIDQENLDLKVAQWHEDETITFVKPIKWHKYKHDTFITLKNEHTDLKLTPDHRCLLKHRKTKLLREFSAQDFPEDYHQFNAGNYIPENTEKFLSNDELKLVIAIQADAHVNQYGIDFVFNKKRKQIRIKEIIDSLGLEHRISPKGKGERIYIYKCELTEKLLTYIPTKEKLFGKWLLDLPKEQQELFCEEIYYWDGCIVRMNDYTSAHKNNVDWVQIMHTLNNERALIIDKWASGKRFHCVLNTKRNYSGTTNIEKKEIVEELQDVYCVSVPSSYIVVRRNERPIIIGNCQQIPRKAGMREIFQASEGYLLCAIDYKYIELRTLAAVLVSMYGKSTLGDAIKSGRDPHCYTGATFNGYGYEEFLEFEKTRPELFAKARQESKITNFGLAGGLGPQSLVLYAKAVYGVIITLEEAQKFCTNWKTIVYPEMGQYLSEDTAYILACNLGTSVTAVWEQFDWKNERNTLCFLPIKKIVEGIATKKDGTPYNPQYVDRIWQSLKELCANPYLIKAIEERKPSAELGRNLFWTRVTSLTGRIRGRVSFTQGKNFPFQSLPVDGAKRVAWRFLEQRHRVVAFIHDEFLIELKDHGGYVLLDEIHELEHIMNTEMEKVMGHGIPSATDFLVSKKWKKKGKMKIEGNRVYPL